MLDIRYNRIMEIFYDNSVCYSQNAHHSREIQSLLWLLKKTYIFDCIKNVYYTNFTERFYPLNNVYSCKTCVAQPFFKSRIVFHIQACAFQLEFCVRSAHNCILLPISLNDCRNVSFLFQILAFCKCTKFIVYFFNFMLPKSNVLWPISLSSFYSLAESN